MNWSFGKHREVVVRYIGHNGGVRDTDIEEWGEGLRESRAKQLDFVYNNVTKEKPVAIPLLQTSYILEKGYVGEQDGADMLLVEDYKLRYYLSKIMPPILSETPPFTWFQTLSANKLTNCGQPTSPWHLPITTRRFFSLIKLHVTFLMNFSMSWLASICIYIPQKLFFEDYRTCLWEATDHLKYVAPEKTECLYLTRWTVSK